MSSRITRSLAVLAFTGTLAACSSVPLDESGAGGTGGTDGATTGQIMDPFNPQSPLAQQRSVYFDFDSYTIPEQYRSVVQMHANYLRGKPQQQVRVEGHADARGGTEYNLALGQRRSDAVARMMELLGVNGGQIEAISFGKERPKALGSTEADYAENRRADIMYQQ
ncbi:MAG: peptidoglycan-associated lipoprotein Pal [Burkholderiaceae bacterium]|jgi:peptidoglycan-associated lipoprotein